MNDSNVPSVAIGIATYNISIFNIERTQYTDKETKQIKNINRVSTNIGVLMVNDDVAEELLKANLSLVSAVQGKGALVQAHLTANCFVQNGVTRWQITKG